MRLPWNCDWFLPAGAHSSEDTDVGCCLLHLFISARVHQNKKKRQKRKEMQMRNYTLLFIFFLCVCVFELSVASVSSHLNPESGGLISQEMVIVLWSYEASLCHHTELRAHGVGGGGGGSRSPTCAPTRWSLLDTPPFCRSRMTNGIKCEQVSAWRDPPPSPENALPSISGGYLTMDKTKELIKQGADNTAAN